MNEKPAKKVYLWMKLMQRSITPCLKKVEVVTIEIEFAIEIVVKILLIAH
jgi:hypothetical protein